MLATAPSKHVIKHSTQTAPQRRFWLSRARYKLFVGGVGSGKTRAGVVEALRQPPRSVGMVLAPPRCEPSWTWRSERAWCAPGTRPR
jgi:cysteine synthase